MAMVHSSPVFSVKKTGDDLPITAPRIRAMRSHDWVEGAVHAARMQRLDGTLHFVGKLGPDFIFRCFDSATSRTEHSLTLNFEKQSLSCSCWDHAREYPCAHIGAMYLLMWQIQQSALPKNINAQQQYGFWSTLNAS